MTRYHRRHRHIFYSDSTLVGRSEAIAEIETSTEQRIIPLLIRGELIEKKRLFFYFFRN